MSTENEKELARKKKRRSSSSTSSSKNTEDSSKAKNSSSKEDDVSLTGAENVVVRNEVSYSIYRKLLGSVFISFIVMVVGIMSAYYFSTKKVAPKYTPVDEDSRFVPLVPLNKPNANNGTIGEIALKTIKAVNTYDYKNYLDQLQQAEKYFTPSGWNDYIKQFQATQTMNTVKENRAIVSVEPLGNVSIVSQDVAANGVYAWKVEVPIKVSYTAHKSGLSGNSNQIGIVTLYLIRVPTTVNPEGVSVQIYQFDTTSKKAQERQ